MGKYIVRMAQESYFEMEVEADSQEKAMMRALQSAIEGGAARDDEREWDDFRALSAQKKV